LAWLIKYTGERFIGQFGTEHVEGSPCLYAGQGIPESATDGPRLLRFATKHCSDFSNEIGVGLKRLNLDPNNSPCRHASAMSRSCFSL
jgi:hypothetical protein